MDFGFGVWGSHPAKLRGFLQLSPGVTAGNIQGIIVPGIELEAPRNKAGFQGF